MVASLDTLSNGSVQKNETVEKLVTANKTLTESIVIIQSQNLKLIKLTENLTAGIPAVENPSTADKPPWYSTGY